MVAGNILTIFRSFVVFVWYLAGSVFYGFSPRVRIKNLKFQISDFRFPTSVNVAITVCTANHTKIVPLKVVIYEIGRFYGLSGVTATFRPFHLEHQMGR